MRPRRRRQKARHEISVALRPHTEKAKLYSVLGEELRRQARERAAAASQAKRSADES